MEQILIVEDDSFLNKMLDYNLTADGYGVTSALNARTAAEAIRQREFDLGQYRTTATIRITGRPFCKNQLGRPCFCSQERTDSSCQAGSVSQNQIR